MKMSKVQCLEAAVAADTKVQKALAAAQGPSSTADHPFEGKAYVQVGWLVGWLFIQYTLHRSRAVLPACNCCNGEFFVLPLYALLTRGGVVG